MEFTELIKIKQIRNVMCMLDVFNEQAEGPGVVIVSAHVLCYESGPLKVCCILSGKLYYPLYCLINSFHFHRLPCGYDFYSMTQTYFVVKLSLHSLEPICLT